jgi:hypothetical protein
VTKEGYNRGGNIKKPPEDAPDNKKDANTGACVNAIYGTAHWNILRQPKPKDGNPSIGSITKCECCEETSSGATIRKNKDNYAIFPKDWWNRKG